MSFAIHKNVSRNDLVSRVPTRFVESIPPSPQLPEKVHLVVFNQTVVRSSAFDKAVRKLEDRIDDPDLIKVFVGSNFTKECIDRVADSSDLIVSDREFYWTDASYDHISVLGHCTVKAPDVRAREKITNKEEAEQVGDGDAEEAV